MSSLLIIGIDHAVLQRAIPYKNLASLAHTQSWHRIATLRQHGVVKQEDPTNCDDSSRITEDLQGVLHMMRAFDMRST